MADTATAPAPARGLVPYAPFTFQQPVRRSRPARIAIEGPSGYGRTPWALMLGQRLGERMAVIDAERGKAAEFAGQISFTHLTLSDDFNPSHLLDALASAAAIRADVVVIDGYSSFWSGPGGLRDLAEQDAQPGAGGRDAGWRKHRPMERRVFEALMAYPGHVILTMRTTTETFIETDESGRHIPVRHAIRAHQRDGLEYDMDLYGSFISAGTLHIVKSSIPTLPLGTVLTEPDEKTATDIAAWAQAGEPVNWTDFVRATEPDVTLDDLFELRELMHLMRVSHMALPGPKGVQNLETILGDRIKDPVLHADAALKVWDDREGLLHCLRVAEAERADKARLSPPGTDGQVVLREWIIARGRALADASPTGNPTPPPQHATPTAEQPPELPPFEPVGLPADSAQWTDEHRALVLVRDMAQQSWPSAEELGATLEVADKQGVMAAEVLDTDTQEIQRLGDLIEARIRFLSAEPDASDDAASSRR